MTVYRSAANDLAADLFCHCKLAFACAQARHNSKQQCLLHPESIRGAGNAPYRISLCDPLYRFFDTLTARVGKLTDPGFLGYCVNQPLSYVTMLGHFIY